MRARDDALNITEDTADSVRLFALKVGADAPHALAQSFNRARISKAHMLARQVAAKINAGGNGDTGFLQQIQRERVTVLGESAAAGIDVKSTLRHMR